MIRVITIVKMDESYILILFSSDNQSEIIVKHGKGHVKCFYSMYMRRLFSLTCAFYHFLQSFTEKY